MALAFYIVDLETTGLSPKLNHEIVELSVIRYNDKVQLTRQVRADFPKCASLDALRVTGKTMNDLKQGVSKLEMMDAFDAFLMQDQATPDARVIVGHNIVTFDRKFLHHQWKKFDRDFQADMWLDTIQMTKRLFAKMGIPKAKTNLQACLDTCGLKKMAGFHSAKGDTRNTFRLFEHLLNSGIDYLDLIKQDPMRKIIDEGTSGEDDDIFGDEDSFYSDSDDSESYE